jgi:hypothetical protein
VQEEEDFRFVLLKAPFIHPHAHSPHCLAYPNLPCCNSPAAHPRRTTALAKVGNFLHKMSVFDKLIWY